MERPHDSLELQSLIEGQSYKADLLVVDDVPLNLHLLVHLLTKEGYKVRPASSGAAALAAAQAEPPDMILLDIMMPEMDGYEVCRRLKADERTRDIPVIFISAIDQAADKVKAFEVGGVDYVTKPIQPGEVIARIQTHLKLRELQKSLEEKNRLLEEEVVERRMVEESLRQYAEELDAFAHTVAHDLKTPLSIIVGYSELLARAQLSPQEQERTAAQIRNTSYKMISIIDELLLLAQVRRLEQVDIEPLDTGAIVAEVLSRLETLISDRQAEISSPENWPIAWGYAPWVEEVWVNYLSNAIKYGGKPPRVELGADRLSNPLQPAVYEAGGGDKVDRDRPYVRFWVRDNGPGLAPEEQVRLFAEFSRLSKMRVQGHGLGLSIVRRIVERLGGEVGVESQIGAGSLFYFTLPAA